MEWLKIYPVIELLSLLIIISYIFFGKKNTPKDVTISIPLWISVPLRHPWIIYTVVGVAGFLIGPILAIFTGLPEPGVHDEFSYLLAADTFAQGRLSNPPHPMWKHFETFHVIHQPTYASKYPPGQGLALAVGQVFFGHPIVGVWLSLGAACAAISWMLAGWVPLRWAWIGGLIAAIQLNFIGSVFPFNKLNLIGYWSQSYWGGAVATLGGALVYGAMPRILKEQRIKDSIWFAAGLAVLANSRPFEGLVSSIPPFLFLFFWIIKEKEKIKRIVIPIITTILMTFAFISYYNYRVTGSLLVMPYQVHEKTYSIVPPFLWQNLKKEPQYNHYVLRKFHIEYVDQFKRQQSMSVIKIFLLKIIYYWYNIFGLLFAPFVIVFVMRKQSWKNKKSIFIVFSLVFVGIFLSTETWQWTHYAAPIICLTVYIKVESLRALCHSAQQRPMLRQHFVKMFLIILLIFSVASYAVSYRIRKSWENWKIERAHIINELENDKKYHLIIINYDDNHNVHKEWVYNRADIDAAKVVWARDMGPQENAKLINYFKNRRIWLLEADKLPRKLIPYSEKLMEQSD